MTQPSELPSAVIYTKDQWRAHLLALSEPVLVGTPMVVVINEAETRAWVDRFEDEAGNRRPVDRPMLSWMLGIDPGPKPARLTPDVALWWALHDPGADPRVLILPGDGPLVYIEDDDSVGMEERTEAELSALHALRAHAVRLPELRARCESSARWHLDTLQPDNATNRPWAVHVFIELALAGGADASAARFQAETLVHNCRIKLGRTDRLSACLLLDAAQILDLHD